jgi:hypothetical protein
VSDAVDVRFQRTLGVLTPETLAGLRSLHVVIAGVGGAGGQAAVDLARMGFGYFTLADFDTYEPTNMNRQVGCFEDTLGQPKVEVVAGLCRRIHPDNRVRTFPRGVTPENAAALLAADTTFPPPFMVYELMDLQGLAAKVALHAACRRAGLPCMTALAVGFGAALHVYAPDAPAYDALYPCGRASPVSPARAAPGLVRGSRLHRTPVPRRRALPLLRHRRHLRVRPAGVGNPARRPGRTGGAGLLAAIRVHGPLRPRVPHRHDTGADRDEPEMNVERFHLSRTEPGGPRVVWGGLCRSGSLKYLTFREYLRRHGNREPAGLIEMSGGCSALALAALAAEHGVPCTAVTDPAGAQHLRAAGFTGEIVVPAGMAEAVALCTARMREGWIWPRQMTNADLIDCVVSWAVRLRAQAEEQAAPRLVVTGFGTGATAAGLERAFADADCTVLAVEAAPGAPISGWRHFDTQNLGAQDLFTPYADRIRREPIHAPAPTPLAALLRHPLPVPSCETLLVSHDGEPPMGDD